MPLADPHCHTVASDGMVTPAELVEAAVKADVDLIAVTDHDTMASPTPADDGMHEAIDVNAVAVPLQLRTSVGVLSFISTTFVERRPVTP